MEARAALDYDRSVENVRVMLYSAMSMICGHRNIFDDNMYEETDFVENEEFYTYEGLLMGEQSKDSPSISPSNVASGWSEPHILLVPLLKPGRGERVDLCLGMLDTVFEALDRKVLHAFRIGFALDDQSPHHLLEQYTFTIKYRQVQDRDREVEGLQCQYGNETNDTHARNLEIKRIDIDLLGNLYELCHQIQPLPSKTYLIASIVYFEQNGWTPDEFEVPAKPAEMASNYQGMQLQEETLGASGSIYHDVSLQATYLKKPDQSSERCLSHNSHLGNPDHESACHATLVKTEENHDDMDEDDMETAQDQDTHAMSIEPLVITSADDESDATLSQYTSSRNSSRGSNAMPSPCPKGSNAAAARSISRKGEPNAGFGIGVGMTSEEQAMEAAPDLVNTAEFSGPNKKSMSQAVEDEKVKDGLDKMMEPSFNTGSALETQLRSDAAQWSEDQDAPSSLFDKHMATYWFLEEEKARQLWHSKDELQRRSRPRTADPADDIINCQCKNQDALQETIRCTICDTFQHPVCYGLMEKDTQYPHVCWQCLLYNEKHKSRTIGNLNEIVSKRQAVNMLLIEKAIDISALSDRVVLAESAALVGELVGGEYAVQRGARNGRKSPSRLELPESVGSPEYLVKLKKLFDPFNPGAIRGLFSAVARDSVHASFKKAIVSRYPVLSQASEQGSSSGTTRPKRRIDEESLSKTSSEAGSRKRARSDESSEKGTNVVPITGRRSQRQTRTTPKMKEAMSNIFINTHADASANNSATKTVRYDWA